MSHTPTPAPTTATVVATPAPRGWLHRPHPILEAFGLDILVVTFGHQIVDLFRNVWTHFGSHLAGQASTTIAGRVSANVEKIFQDSRADLLAWIEYELMGRDDIAAANLLRQHKERVNWQTSRKGYKPGDEQMFVAMLSIPWRSMQATPEKRLQFFIELGGLPDDELAARLDFIKHDPLVQMFLRGKGEIEEFCARHWQTLRPIFERKVRQYRLWWRVVLLPIVLVAGFVLVRGIWYADSSWIWKGLGIPVVILIALAFIFPIATTLIGIYLNSHENIRRNDPNHRPPLTAIRWTLGVILLLLALLYWAPDVNLTYLRIALLCGGAMYLLATAGKWSKPLKFIATLAVFILFLVMAISSVRTDKALDATAKWSDAHSSAIQRIVKPFRPAPRPAGDDERSENLQAASRPIVVGAPHFTFPHVRFAREEGGPKPYLGEDETPEVSKPTTFQMMPHVHSGCMTVPDGFRTFDITGLAPVPVRIYVNCTDSTDGLLITGYSSVDPVSVRFVNPSGDEVGFVHIAPR